MYRRSKKYQIVMTHPIHREVIQKFLSPYAQIKVVKHSSEFKKYLKKADALISLLSDSIDSKVLSQGYRLKVIGNYAVGINNIDLKYCKKRKIRVVNTPRVLTRATAELALALLLACVRRLPEGESLCRLGKFKGWAPDLLLGLELKGRHAVLVGKGRIGTETGKLFRHLGMTVEWITRSDSENQIQTKLKRAQILSLHIPLTSETRHWLNRPRLGFLPRDAVVVNTTRGPVVDEMALIQALQKKKIFAAGLDVYENEPEIPISLRKLKNVVLAPHIGSATQEARHAMAKVLVDGVLSVLSGKRPWNEVSL